MKDCLENAHWLEDYSTSVIIIWMHSWFSLQGDNSLSTGVLNHPCLSENKLVQGWASHLKLSFFWLCSIYISSCVFDIVFVSRSVKGLLPLFVVACVALQLVMLADQIECSIRVLNFNWYWATQNPWLVWDSSGSKQILQLCPSLQLQI